MKLNSKTYLHAEYIEKGRSTYDIAQELGTYPNKVRRALIHHGIPIRDKGEAQSLALASGRGTHPTEGTERPSEVKNAIAASVAESWANLSDTEKERRREQSKKNWEELSEDAKAEMRAEAARQLKETAKTGSKLEKYLLVGLQLCGYQVEFHAPFLVDNEKMHIDLVLPALKVAIEVDGPTHYAPIYSEEQLEKNRWADTRKNGLLNQKGYKVIRIKHKSKTLSRYRMNRLLTRLTSVLESKLDMITTLEI